MSNDAFYKSEDGKVRTRRTTRWHSGRYYEWRTDHHARGVQAYCNDVQDQDSVNEGEEVTFKAKVGMTPALYRVLFLCEAMALVLIDHAEAARLQGDRRLKPSLTVFSSKTRQAVRTWSTSIMISWRAL